MDNKFTQKAQIALNRSVKIAEELGHTYIGTEHLLLALLEDELSCSALIFGKYSVTAEKVETIIREYSGTGRKTVLTAKHLTPRAKSILENSYNLAIRYGNTTIGTEHLLLALLEEKESVALKLMKKAKVETTAIRDEALGLLKTRERQSLYRRNDSGTPLLRQYGKNLCEMARDEKFDPVTARDRETERVIRILLRKTKNNPCLIGEAGVGKTAIIEGLAARIVSGRVPEALKDKTIISVDLTSMIAGAKYRGDFEDRIKNIISEVVKNKNIILFIDEIHTIVGAGAAEGAIDASNILKPQLARGELQLIGATTLSEYHKYIEKDAALERRFQPIIVEEPDESSTICMLQALKSRYEKHHNVHIENEALIDCVHLSGRFISDRYFPDKAVDVLDEACVIARNNVESGEIRRQIDDIDKVVDNDILSAYYGEHTEVSLADGNEKTIFVTSEDIKSAISEICNIPKRMIKKELDYVEIISELNDMLPGHEKEVEKIINSIKRHDIGFSPPDRPRGIFLFVGESGTGKTAMAIELAKKLFFADHPLIRYDMSEFSEKQSISKLIGSPPGYVGHEDGGGLTEAVRKRPHSLILFDEIEKADKDVLNILLQIADYGYLSDSSGRKVNFKNTVIIMTSNIGCSPSRSMRKPGFVNSNNSDIEAVTEALQKRYTPEFINRFDEIIFFEEISEDTLAKIAEKKLDELKEKATICKHELNYDSNLPHYLAEKSQKRSGGVRALIKEISDSIEKPLIELLVCSKDTSGKSLFITLQDNEIFFANNNPLKI